MGYSGDLVQVVSENEHVEFVIPREGCLMSCDMLCIPFTAKNLDLTYKFINFIHKPENAKTNIEFTEYLCPNKDAYPLLPKEVRENPAIFISPEIFAKSKFTADQGENEGVYNQIWQDIKAGK
ncbi:MAG: extracellular solute-binding protein [Victivallales bacterium]|nr:extracellular solute-binding protein [Victivallales bacterium]